MKTPATHYRKRRSASKAKRSSTKKKDIVSKRVDEEEVVWFSNPSKEAARACREEAKDIMGRELWKAIMEDSSDDDDKPEEEFYFYDGGWHNSPQTHVHLEGSRNKGNSSQEVDEVDYSVQGFEVGEDIYPTGVVYHQNSNHCLDNNTRVTVPPVICGSETHKVLDESDANDTNDCRNNGLASVEELSKPNEVVIAVEIEMPDDDTDSLKQMPEQVEMAQGMENTMVVMALEHADITQEEQSGRDVVHIQLFHDDSNDVAVRNDDDANMELRMTTHSTQSKSAVLDIEKTFHAMCILNSVFHIPRNNHFVADVLIDFSFVIQDRFCHVRKKLI